MDGLTDGFMLPFKLFMRQLRLNTRPLQSGPPQRNANIPPPINFSSYLYKPPMSIDGIKWLAVVSIDLFKLCFTFLFSCSLIWPWRAHSSRICFASRLYFRFFFKSTIFLFRMRVFESLSHRAPALDDWHSDFLALARSWFSKRRMSSADI